MIGCPVCNDPRPYEERDGEVYCPGCGRTVSTVGVPDPREDSGSTPVESHRTEGQSKPDATVDAFGIGWVAIMFLGGVAFFIWDDGLDFVAFLTLGAGICLWSSGTNALRGAQGEKEKLRAAFRLAFGVVLVCAATACWGYLGWHAG